MSVVQVPVAKPSEHGSKTLDEFEARMRDAGYEDWEIEEEVADMIDTQKRTAENTRLFKEMAAQSQETPISRSVSLKQEAAHARAEAAMRIREGHAVLERARKEAR